jgi:hypothetical protein
MSKVKLALGLLAVLMVPCISLAQEAPHWTYVEAGYVDFDPESSSGDSGAYGEGSWGIFKSFHLLGEYAAAGDYTLWNLGGGWHGLLGEKADLLAEISWSDFEFDSSGGKSTDDGYEIGAGVRWNLLTWLELRGAINYLDLDESGDDTSVEVEGVVALLKGRLGVGVNYEAGDADTLKVFGRFNFGKKK